MRVGVEILTGAGVAVVQGMRVGPDQGKQKHAVTKLSLPVM